MKKEEIIPFDWHRFLFGQAPAEFLIEVFIRTSVIYIVLLIIVRLLGKRMSGQLSISELAIMVTLGAIVAPAMQIPQMGVLQGAMILVCALAFQRGLNLMEFKKAAFEEVSQGQVSTLVKDGIIQLKDMKEAKVSRQQLFSSLRNENIFNLGDVSRVYLEACGMFSIYKKEEPIAGLPIFPPSDPAINRFSQEIAKHAKACTTCGNVTDDYQKDQPCPVCDSVTWITATISVSKQSNLEHSNP
jgi:uncharacterized membrane protein YcaP (DUF421 family)